MNMNHDCESEFERRLEQLPADDAVRFEHREALRERALAAFDQAALAHQARPGWKRILHLGRNVMQRPLPRYLVAASVLAALAWVLWPGGNGTAHALERIVDAVVSARSARFQAEVTTEGQPKQTARTSFLAPAKYRMEFGKMVSISDFDAAKMLTLMPEQKQAVVFNLKNMPKDAASMEKMSHFEVLRRLLSEQRGKQSAYQQLGEKTIDGRKAMGFRMDSGIGTLTLWGDAKTGHPIRIENIYSGVPKMEVVMTQFEMNVDLKAELFALDVPGDYKLKSFDIEASKPQERDLVESLRVCASMSDGTFPDALDTQSVMKLIIATALGGKKGDNGPDVDLLMKKSIKIGRGFEFALNLPASARAHYAGKGVKLDTKDRPIFWYQPEGSQRYRVADATLTLRDADEAPRVEGAVPLAKKIGVESK